MLRIYICPQCGSTRIVSNNHDSSCLYCDIDMERAQIPYEEFVNMDLSQRNEFTSKWLEKNR